MDTTEAKEHKGFLKKIKESKQQHTKNLSATKPSKITVKFIFCKSKITTHNIREASNNLFKA